MLYSGYMKSDNARAVRIAQLRQLIAYHAEQYHTHDAPELSDEAYDALARELVALEGAHALATGLSPTHAVGGKVLDGFTKTKHLVPQWSYDNVFDIHELKQWDERNRKILEKEGNDKARLVWEYCCELKIDGLKIVLTYDQGKLLVAATRGDGTIGEDITENIRMVKSIPQVIADTRKLVIIGEVWMKKTDLEKINNERKAANLPLYANPRNLAAGTLRQLDTSVVAERDLQVYCYDIEVIGDAHAFATHAEELEHLRELGFQVHDKTKTVTTLEDVDAFVAHWIPLRNHEEYAVDGVVIKLNDTSVREILGYTAKSPRFGVAYKFPAEEVTTIVENIDIQVGRTGVLTPVAHVRPVLVAGSTVSRATLHNQDEIDRLDVRIGDTVVLRKAGDIIPEILQVITELRPVKTKKFTIPKTCPVCNGSVQTKTGGTRESVALYCINVHCPAQSLENLIHYASKKALNIVGMGQKIVEKLVNEGLIQTPVDIYTLQKSDLEGLEKFGELSATNIIDSIESSKKTTLQRFLFGLGIHHIGEETADLIAQGIVWNNNDELFQKLITLTDADLVKIPGIGSIVAESFIDYMQDPDRQEVVKKLIALLVFEQPEKVSQQQLTLSNKIFVVTGTLETLSRDDAKALIKKHGGKVASAVSKNTNYLLMGENAGSKYDEALKLGITIITEQDFKVMLGNK